MPAGRRTRLLAVGAIVLAALGVVALLGSLRAHRPHHAGRAGRAAMPRPGVVPYRHATTSVPAGSLHAERFYSPALHRIADYIVYLPPGYDAAARAGRRFPVLYLLHAPPGSPTGYITVGQVPQHMDALIAQRRIRPYVIVIPNARTATDGNDTEWANAEAGRYEDFVLDLVHAVDARWATIRDRADRGIAGISEGGYGAVNLALRHLPLFGVFESWSGYFVQTPTESFRDASAALLRANSPTLYVAGLRAQLQRYPERGFVYRGAGDRTTTAADQAAFVSRLRAAGGRVAAATYPGTHTWRLWRWRMVPMLRFASASFAPARG